MSKDAHSICALLAIVEKWKPPKCASLEEWLNYGLCMLQNHRQQLKELVKSLHIDMKRSLRHTAGEVEAPKLTRLMTLVLLPQTSNFFHFFTFPPLLVFMASYIKTIPSLPCSFCFLVLFLYKAHSFLLALCACLLLCSSGLTALTTSKIWNQNGKHIYRPTPDRPGEDTALLCSSSGLGGQSWCTFAVEQSCICISEHSQVKEL